MTLKRLKTTHSRIKRKKSKLKTPEKEKLNFRQSLQKQEIFFFLLIRSIKMRLCVGRCFREALNENNSILKNDISSTITTDVIHEMDFILEAKERRQEERIFPRQVVEHGGNTETLP